MWSYPDLHVHPVLHVEHRKLVFVLIFDVRKPLDNVGRALPLVEVEGGSQLSVYLFQDGFTDSAELVLCRIYQSRSRVVSEVLFVVF